MTEDRLQRLVHADSVLQVLWETIHRDWPEKKSEVTDCIHAYYKF